MAIPFRVVAAYLIAAALYIGAFYIGGSWWDLLTIAVVGAFVNIILCITLGSTFEGKTGGQGALGLQVLFTAALIAPFVSLEMLLAYVSSCLVVFVLCKDEDWEQSATQHRIAGELLRTWLFHKTGC
jgi:hypothetical protein